MNTNELKNEVIETTANEVENNVENKETYSLENHCYKFEEMGEAMQASLKNLEKVIKQQTRLLEIVKSAEDAKDFEEFVKESEAQLENLNKQKESLTLKIRLTSVLLEKCSNSQECSEVVSLLTDILGLFASE